MVRITNRRIAMTHDEPSISGAGDPETNRTSPDVGASNTLPRAIFFWSPRFPSLSGRFIARSGHCYRLGGLFLSGGGRYRVYISNDRAMLRSRMAAGTLEHFSSDIGQSRPYVFLKLDDFVQLAIPGTLKDHFVRMATKSTRRRKSVRGRADQGGNIRRGSDVPRTCRGHATDVPRRMDRQGGAGYDWRLTLL